MKPAPFRYVAARSLAQALELKAEYGDEARFLAGGQSLVPTMNFRLTQPAMLIDINPLKEFAGVRKNGADRLRIGALTRYRSLERDPATAADLPLIARGVAAHRASADPQPRYHRRQPRARRPGVGNAGDRAGARRPAARPIGARRALDRGC